MLFGEHGIKEKIEKRKFKKQVGCKEKNCKSFDARFGHDKCIYCHRVTCSRMSAINPETLKRKLETVCSKCSVRHDESQQPWRELRRSDDWKYLTDKIADNLIVENVLPEQYDGVTRKTLRAFAESDSKSALVLETTASALNTSIVVLGLENEMYAEQRSDKTILRKVKRD